MLHTLVTSMAWLVAAQAQTHVNAKKSADPQGLLRPTEIRLDFQDRALAEIVDGINAQTPGLIALRPEPRSPFPRQRPRPANPPRRFSLREPRPVSFWEAVDRVGRATETWPVSGNGTDGRLRIHLVPASPDRGFVSHDGAFRVIVSGTSYTSAFQFAPYFFHQPGLEQPKRDGSSRRPIVSVHLTVTAEPRLTIHGPIELVVHEAVDDRGRSLLPAVPYRQSWTNPSGGPKGWPNEEHIAVPLMTLEDPGKRIQRIQGSVSLLVSARETGSPQIVAKVTFDFADIPLP
jgi:hypothetical protein